MESYRLQTLCPVSETEEKGLWARKFQLYKQSKQGETKENISHKSCDEPWKEKEKAEVITKKVSISTTRVHKHSILTQTVLSACSKVVCLYIWTRHLEINSACLLGNFHCLCSPYNNGVRICYACWYWVFVHSCCAYGHLFQWLLHLLPFMDHHMICGLCFPLFLFVCFVCIVEIFVPRVSSLQSLTLGTSVLPCGLFEQCMAYVWQY